MKITVGPRRDCAVAVTKYNATHIFSIQEGHEKGDPQRKIPTPQGIIKHNHFFFQDLNSPELKEYYDIKEKKMVKLYPPTSEDIRDILDKAKGLPARAHLFLHCFAGISRSPACAFAIICQILGGGKEELAVKIMVQACPYGGISPNGLIIQYADEILNRNGRMIKAIDNYARSESVEWENIKNWVNSKK